MSAKSNDSGHLKVVSIRRRYVQNTLQQHAFTHTKIIATAKRNIWATTRRMNPSECITNNRTHNKAMLLYSIYIFTQLSVYVCGCFYVMKQMDWGAPPTMLLTFISRNTRNRNWPHKGCYRIFQICICVCTCSLYVFV